MFKVWSLSQNPKIRDTNKTTESLKGMAPSGRGRGRRTADLFIKKTGSTGDSDELWLVIVERGGTDRENHKD